MQYLKNKYRPRSPPGTAGTRLRFDCAPHTGPHEPLSIPKTGEFHPFCGSKLLRLAISFRSAVFWTESLRLHAEHYPRRNIWLFQFPLAVFPPRLPCPHLPKKRSAFRRLSAPTPSKAPAHKWPLKTPRSKRLDKTQFSVANGPSFSPDFLTRKTSKTHDPRLTHWHPAIHIKSKK